MPPLHPAPKRAAAFSFPSGNPAPSPTKPRAAHDVRILSGLDNLQRVTALHEQVRAEMPDKQRHFLLPKPPEYFRDLLTGKTGVLLGAFADDELVGSLSMMLAASFAAAHAEGRLTCPDPDGRWTKEYRQGRIGVIQAMGLRSAYMGRGFSRTLIQATIEQAARHDCAHLFAQIAEQNTLSWLRFLDQDFAILAAWTSGHRRFLLRWLAPEEKARLIKHAKPADHITYGKNYAQLPVLQDQLAAKLDQGRIALFGARPYDDDSLSIVFSPGRRR